MLQFNESVVLVVAPFLWDLITLALSLLGSSLVKFFVSSVSRCNSQRFVRAQTSEKKNTLDLEELHKKAWTMVGAYMKENLRIFTSKAKDAESTVLPPLTAYIDEAFADIPEVRSTEDHGVFLWGNLPACGVMGVHTYEWIITAVSNLLAVYRRNGMALLIYPNRGSQPERTVMDSKPVHTARDSAGSGTARRRPRRKSRTLALWRPAM